MFSNTYLHCNTVLSLSTDSRPTLQVLQALPTSRGDINVIEATAVQWKTVGTALSISSDRIEIIQADNPRLSSDAPVVDGPPHTFLAGSY